ncbi:SDR family NAD(P)-dependent oxidoreductase [Streptomyces acidiscabies]|uniref:SDR family NAD(P)-dependent oxidoreductase n=1 Tax=Streptomyces acidiscabies TaxID=42234 RepID=A0AAP6EH76_9ACTN|nr:SDR family NAD(P)-dependent oxidoreductase [Streptomyces acidiscabies]MDX2962703.1 SDR family NAD(P)-dependent oxidoreductase [Streptomyces acidiscabies]MDX3790338.1 SDR family NAD(P)-dependent oxidoreductase [Streptomyces acidiscabies]GAV43017.1 polyketide synthase PksN [Streptomyces acidiscabies]
MSSHEIQAAETDVAIIGMAGRFPGADDLDSFWRLLREGREGITRFGREELAAAGVPARLLDDPTYVPAHGIIPDVDLFDTGYFEFTPAEAAITDPQHRVLLTAGHAALEHAGYDPARYDGLISVYVGAAVNTYLQQQVLPNVDQTTTSSHFAVMVGNDKDYLATRLSYKLDLKGPSYAVQTACSTSLVAVHLACQGLVNGECDIALAGGVTVKVPQEKGYLYEEGAILSEDGYVRTFDADASGTVLGNGVGVVVLKPLRDALADRDTVYAVIKGTATNNDGSGKVSFAAPGAAGQAAVIREAHSVSGVDPRSIGYVEAHGTATRLGDPVEVSALTRAFRDTTADTGFCALGSVKSNLGHLDAAAGVAGLIKTALMLKHRTLVPTVNYTTPNPAIDFAAGPFKVSTETVPWTGDGPLRAGISSFGIGGTNAHAVVEEAPSVAVTGGSRASQVLVVSARTPTALATAATNLADHLDGDDSASLADVAYTLAVGRRAHEYRLAVTGGERAELARALREAAVPERPGTGEVSFVFTEEVPDAGSLAGEWAAEPAFAAYYEAALAAGAGQLGERGRAFAVQYALGRLWLDWGVTPVAVHGDGVAGRVAACVAGELTLAEAVGGESAGSRNGAASGRPRRARIPVLGALDEVRGVALGVADGPWQGLARAWQARVDVNWTAWFEGEERGRVPLPTYPFEGRRCWLDAPAFSVPEPAPSAAGPHPMLDENVSTLDTLAYRSSRTGTEFYLADHRVNGAPVMPAAGQVELVRAAGELALGQPMLLRGVSFERLLSYADGPRTTLVRLWPEDDAVGFQLADGDEVVASGSIGPAPVDPPAPVDLTPVADRCGEVVGHGEAYDVLRGLGLDYGARMRALREVRLGDGEALGVLDLPEGAEFDGAALNPALIDGALHALVVLLARAYGESAEGFLPLALGELVVHAPVVEGCRVHVTVGELGERTARADLTLVDGHGRVLARLNDLAVRVLGEVRDSALLVRRWVDAPLPVTGVELSGTARVVGSPEWASVLTGLGFEVVTEAAPDVVLVDLVDSVDEPAPERVLRAVQDLLAARPTSPVRVLLLHRNDPALGAFARTVRAENPLLAIQAIGLGEGVNNAEALGAELAGHGRDLEVSHTTSGRRVLTVEAAPSGDGPVVVRDGGVYLVTGGAGGLGRIVAEWLLARADVRVVAVGRGERPADLDDRVAYRRADVTDRAQLAAVHTEFGPFNGIVHAAGVLRDGFALTKSAEDFAAVLAPKVAGIEALDAVTADDSPDFFVAFSSIAAHIGNPGQSDYAYANARLESYAERHSHVTTIAWPLWAEGGMRQSTEDASDVAARTGFGTLSTATGLALFEQALGMRGAVIAAHGDVRRITTALTALAPETSRPAATQGAAPRARAVALLRELIAAETGLDAAELVEGAPFERYGIDSLMIAKLNRELERHFANLSKTLFFEYTSLGELADYFAERHAGELSAPGEGECDGGTSGKDEGAPAGKTATPAVARTVHRPKPGAEASGLAGTSPDDGAIAIVGLAGRYPSADDLDEFWENLSAGRDSITEIPNDRWDSTRWYDPDPAAPGLAHTRWGGFLRDVDRFDPLFFGISPRQAELMDPQERLFLLNSWHLLEDAGYRRADLAGRPVGVYVGVMYGEYQFHGALDALRGGRPLTGSSFATIANRVSHALNLSGPSMALDTMCSSSLTAIHLACESLRRGESELAIAGGVNVSVHPYKFGFLSQGRFLSDDGRCRAFGAGGTGYVPGEGVGAVLLKPYRKALADGDRVQGVILGSAINHGARTNGYSVPNPRAQQQVISTALREAGVAPGEISYVEAHGTGTSLGDPIELTGLTNAYGTEGSWPIGSAKSNIGHLESAAGIAGLTKVLLQFRHRTLVPSLHAEELNPNIDFGRSPFHVQRELSAWPEGNGPRRAGLSSFGAGGANAHLVLEESSRPDVVTEAPAGEQRVDEPVLFLLSARDEERLRAHADRAADFVATERVPLADLCFTSQVGREALDVRFAVLVTEGAELVAALREFADGGPVPAVTDDAARRWLRGEDVDWDSLHADRPGPAPRRVRAPLYPFADEPYWIPLDAEFGPAAPHALVDANESTVSGIRFRKTLRASDALLRDHVIEGRPLFAGAATLEFVRAAAGLAEPGVRHALRDVVWGRAVELDAGQLELYVSFRPEGGHLAFEVHSEDGTHARGIAVPASSAPDAAGELAALRGRLSVVRDRSGVYRDYADAGFAYGPSFQVVDEIRAGAGEALVRLGDGQPWALLDGALRACHWATPWSGDLAVPFSLGSLDAFAELSAGSSAHARLVGESAGVRRFDVTVYDAQGQVVAVVRDFAGRTTSGTTGGPRLYEPYWRPAPEPELGEAAPTLAVLGNHPALEAELRASGAWARVVSGGDLMSSASDSGLDVVVVSEPDDTLSPAELLDRLCAPVLDVLDGVRTGALGGRVRCVVVHPEGAPEGEAFAGFALSTAPVAPRLEMLTLEVAAGASVREIAGAVTGELRAVRRVAGLEVRRTAAGQREVRGLRVVAGAGGGGVSVRDGGVYVVTGGGGAVGRVLVEHLASKYAARLVLIGRSEPDEETRAWHASLGAEVLAVRADVANSAELEAALGVARERFGVLHGVFHLAGVADEGRADGDRERFARVLAAKTHGLVHLDELTRGDGLELFVVFSSVSSLVGDFGAVSYATANRFADVYTARRGGVSLAWPLWAVGGVDGMVREEELAAYTRRSGMRALEAGQGVELFRRSLAVGVPWVVPAWGEPGVLDGALAGGAGGAASAKATASTGQAERRVSAPAPASAPGAATSTGVSTGAARRERLVAHLREVLAGVLKLSTGRLDSRVPLDDYGLDSVLVMESNSLLGKDFPGLRGTVFFECRTVDELADHVLAEHADAVARLFPEEPQTAEALRATYQHPLVEQATTPPAPSPVHHSPDNDPIAVIGISGRYPGADTLDDFWRNLAEGRNSVTEVPADRWDASELADSGRSTSRWGGFLSDVGSFDSLFFQISPKQARTMDPQERLLLQTAWSALESAGYPPSRIPAPRFGGQGHDVGVFVGVMWDDYAILGATESARGNPQVVLANRSSIANQVSYFGDFRGPSVVIDTACSASLVAVHQACESIRRGECSYALAGGVNVAVHPDKYVHLSAKSMLSDDGRCRAFGAGGTGYVPGEGVGAVLLKRLSEAVRDGDTVHAVIRATGVNHGGRTSGYTVPNPQAQQALVEQVLDAAGVDARTVGCVEAHGTGTALGDPIEHTALAQAFGKHTADTGFCAIGSVKSNIGHLEGAAGIAGLTKAVLQLRHGTLLPSLHAEELNPVIDFTRSPFAVQREVAEWTREFDAEGRAVPRRAAVSSFGAGGTNAHVVLEEYVALAPDEPDSARELIVLSARDEERLRLYAAELGRAVADAPRLSDVAHTLRVGREPLVERLAFVASGLADAAEKLAAVGRGEGGQWLHRGRVEQHPPLADLLTAGVGAEEFLSAQIRAGADDLLGRMWVSGVTVDWELLERLRPAARRRVPLPTYPFERVRHWLDTSATSTAPTGVPESATTHTLVAAPASLAAHTPAANPAPVAGQAPAATLIPVAAQAPVADPASIGMPEPVADPLRAGTAPPAAIPTPATAWHHRLTPDTPALRDHMVDGRPILPGVGHLDLVAEATGGLTGRALADIRWAVPLTAEDVTVAFDGDRYDVLGADNTVRSTGRLAQAGPTPSPLDTDALRARLAEDHSAFYRNLAEQGLPYGPFFRRVRQIWTGTDEVLGRIGAVDDDPAHALHPGILDAALHTYAALLVRRSRPMLPFAADRVDVFGPVPVSGWSYVRETGPNRCEVLLCDDSGTVRVRFEGLTYREAKPRAVIVHRPVWTPQPAKGRAEFGRSVLYVGEPVAELHPGTDVRRVPTDFTDAEIGTPDLVYFFGTAPAQDPVDRSDVRELADNGPLALYRLVRALDRSGALERGVRLKVVTTDVHPLEDGDVSSPWAAGLFGIAAVAAKEFPALHVSLIDVRAAEAGQLAGAIVAEPFPAKPAPVSIRGGVRRVRTLERVELPSTPTRLRKGGVYLVVGGLGAVGRDTCLHLARTYGAKLVVVGRSPLDEDRHQKVAGLEKAGAEVRYLALDATDPAALTDAVDLAVREFGALHGVFNAAMVLVNRVLRDLSEDEMRAALEVKTGTAWALLHAVRELPLDFALFYSSGVAFEGNHGQAGYAAGCAFADAYAAHAARTLPFPVRVLNLGYWHAAGDAERERVLSRFEAAGIRPLSAERGMTVVERTLGAELPQVFALDADRPILDNLGIDADRTLKVVPDVVPGTLPEVRFPAGPDPELAAHQRVVAEVEVLTERLLAAVLRRAGLTDPSQVVPEHRELFKVQLGIVKAGPEEGKEAELVARLHELTEQHSSLAPVVTLLTDCLTALPDILTGRRPAMEVLFPDGSTERVAAVYRGDPVTDRCNAEVARIVVEQVKSRLAQGNSTVRVLEVGAGTGGTTAAVLAALAPYGDAVEYVFTDVSPAFVRKAGNRFGARYPFVRFEVLDIEAGTAAGEYDVVFGTNVLHATRRLSRTLTRAKELLRRGGVLLAVEGTRPRSQLALIFGLTTGWWLFDDPEQRMPGSPLASERQWRDVLAACGFTGISVGAPGSEAGVAFQSVIAAVSDGVVTHATPTAGPAPTSPATALVVEAPPQTATPTPTPTPASTDPLHQVTDVFATVLEMTPDQLNPDLTFENYGVDSLVVLELTRALEAVYGPQSATLLFERITIRQLADHFRAKAALNQDPPLDEAERLIAGMSDKAVEQLLAELLSQQTESEGGDR